MAGEKLRQNDVRIISWWWTLRLCICTLKQDVLSTRGYIPSYRSIHSIFTDHECWNQYKLQGNALMTQDSSVHQPCSIVILVYRVFYEHFIWGNTPSRSVPYCIYMYMYFPIRFLGVENQVKCWGVTVVRW